MIKHGSGMALCFKYVTNKVPSVAPLALQLSHASVCSRQLSKHSVKSLFLQERIISGDSASLFSSDRLSFGDSVISHGKVLKSKCESDVIRYISCLIFDFEDNSSTTSIKECTRHCQCGANLYGVPYRGTPDDFKLSENSNLSRKHEDNLLHSNVEDQNLSSKNELEDLNQHNAKNKTTTPQLEDPFQPPSEEQLQLVVQKLSNDLPKFFTKPLDVKIYHNNIIFEDNIRGKRFSGIQQYNLQAKLIWFIGHLRFMFVNLDVLKITSHIEDGTVKVRWKISVIRLRKLLALKLSDFSSSISDAKETWVDGFSTYYVMGDGLVHKHVADKMIPDRNPVIKKQGPQVPVPTPLAYSDRNKV